MKRKNTINIQTNQHPKTRTMQMLRCFLIFLDSYMDTNESTLTLASLFQFVSTLFSSVPIASYSFRSLALSFSSCGSAIIDQYQLNRVNKRLFFYFIPFNSRKVQNSPRKSKQFIDDWFEKGTAFHLEFCSPRFPSYRKKYIFLCVVVVVVFVVGICFCFFLFVYSLCFLIFVYICLHNIS